MKRAHTACALALLFLALFWATPPESRAEDTDEAFELNRDAMVDMSMAEFASAAEKFIKAASLVPDYGIKDRKLQYTPNFMAGWAFEKMGKIQDACVFFRKFLDIAPPGDRELTKTEHAQDYVDSHCGL
jgi:tetratricopeptide (TPR) repeat protein